jgi:hypothetical protein
VKEAGGEVEGKGVWGGLDVLSVKCDYWDIAEVWHV